MKEKKVKKIIKLTIEEIRGYDNPVPMKEEGDINSSEYDSEVSDKFKNMILNLINYKENLHINVDSDRINISTGDIYSIKNRKKNTLVREEDQLEISIRKGKGFEINRGYRVRTSYQDPKMYDELVDTVKSTLKQLNSENFISIWSEIMKESGVLRDKNLNQIFGDE